MKRRTFTCELQGGLGNQLFQLAAADYVSKKNGFAVNANIDKLQTGRATRIFSIPEEILKILCPEATVTKSSVPLLLKRICWRVTSFFPTHFFSYEYRQSEIGYDSRLDSNFNFHRLNGYFQTYKYVDSLNWRSFLEENVMPNSEIEILLNRMKTANPVVLHIRGGDYLIDKSGIGNLSENYFKQCLSEIAGKDDEIWIFTDDRNHATKLLSNLSYNFIFIDQENLLSPFSALFLMSKANRIIISNSTFSWWAAYFSSNSQIYSPNKWFKKLSDPAYLIPGSWNRVPSEWLSL
jgi:hypothetical protein